MFINLTPHPITIQTANDDLVLQSSGVARCDVRRELVGQINGVIIHRNAFGKIEGLPEPQEGVFYIVSFPVLQALNGTRPDVFAPDTTPQGAIRNETGQIIAVRGLQTL